MYSPERDSQNQNNGELDNIITRKSSHQYKNQVAHEKTHLEQTIPISPQLQTSKRGKYESEFLTSDEIKSQRIQEELDNYKRERDKAEKRKFKVLYGPHMIPIRSEKSLTEPEDFKFATDIRLGVKRAPAPPLTHSDNLINDNDGGTARHNHFKEKKLELTVPKPFHFHISTRAGSVKEASKLSKPPPPTPLAERVRNINLATPEHWKRSPRMIVKSLKKKTVDSNNNFKQKKQLHSSPYVPLAEKMRKLLNATPDHWKDKPKSPRKPLFLTKPVEPVLHTSLRSKPTNQSSFTKESSENSRSFKALAFNPKIFEGFGDAGIRRVTKKPVTVAQSPYLRVKKRAQVHPTPEQYRKVMLEKLRKAREFKALPINASCIHNEKRIHQVPEELLLTVPESPFLRTKERSSLHSINISRDTNRHHKVIEFKAREMPMFNKSTVPSIEPLPLTQIEPFKLETETRSALNSTSNKNSNHEIKSDPKEFHARPMPLSEPFRPVLELKFTDIDEFNLRSEILHEYSLQKLEEQIQDEEKKAEIKRQFKASDFKKVTPFTVHPSEKPLTQIDQMKLNTDIRALEREEFEKNMKVREKAQQESQKYHAALEAERLKAEKKIRSRLLIHKPVPLPNTIFRAPPAAVSTSHKPLTQPITPKFMRKHEKVVLAGRDI